MKSATLGLIAGILIAQLMPAAATAGSVEVDYSEFWTVADVSGSVSAVVGANSWNQTRTLILGEQVGPHSLIETGTDGEVILIRGGDRITRTPKSNCRLSTGRLA